MKKEEWSSEDERTFQGILQERDALSEKLNKLSPGARWGLENMVPGLREGLGMLGTTAGDVARGLPATAGSMIGGEALSRGGKKIVSKLPGALKPVGALGTYLAGRLGGSVAGGVAAEAMTQALTQEEIDYERLWSTGEEQLGGEVLSSFLGGGRGPLRMVRSVPLDAESAIIAKGMSDDFRRAYGMMTPEARQKANLDPKFTPKVVELGGLTAAQQRDSRILDLLHGAASGTAFGGRDVTKFAEHADILSREVASNIAEDVGAHMDPADLGYAIRKTARGEFKARKAEVIPYLKSLPKDLRIDIHTVKWDKLPPHLRKWQDVDSMSIQQYRQMRSGLQALRDDPTVRPELYHQAIEGIKQLDRRAMRSLDATGKTALKQVQRIEEGLVDDYIATGLMKGLLRSEGGARKYVDSLINKPDYLDLKKLMKVIPDEDVKASLREALVRRTLGDAFLPTGRMRGDFLRKNLEDRIGRKVIGEIVGKPTLKAMERFVGYREKLQALKGRGEPGRVAVSLGQMTTAGSAAYSALSGRYGRSLALGLALLGGPGYAGKLLTDPRTSRQYVELWKGVASERTPKAKVVKMWQNVAPYVLDKAIVERVAGRALVQATGAFEPPDPELDAYFNQKAAEEKAEMRIEPSVIQEQEPGIGGAFLPEEMQAP